MKNELINKLTQSNAHRSSRMSVCNFVIRKDLVSDLVDIAFDVKNENHFKAFWTLEFVCEKKMKLFAPFFDDFCAVLPSVTNESALRSATKIVLFLAKSNHRKNGISLNKEQEHQLIENMIDRLIQDIKVASKVYAMKALYVFGKKYDWIYEELKPIIAQDAFEHSYAYQTSARNILKKIDKIN
jgi:hypothetical protein